MFELLLFSGFGPNKKRLQGAAGLNSSQSGPLTSKQNVGRSDQQKFTSPSMKSNNIIIREKHLIGSGGHGTFANLIYCLAISSLLLIQTGGEAKLAELESQQVGKPCICNSTFFKVCPPAGQCMENIIMGGRTTKNPRHYLPRDQPSWPSAEKFDDPGYDPGNWPTPDTDYFHGGSDDDDDYTDWIHEADPDHVPIEHDPSPFDPTPIKPGGGGYYGDDLPPLAPDLSPGGGGPIGMDRPDPVLESAKQSGDGDKVVRHRKVYLKPQKWPKGDVPIHPIKIRIPVRMPESSEPDLPAPQPMFKIKKYTTYESRPEIQMVPVTKTIIKPVGISPDQIIDETDGGSYRKMFV